MAEWKAEVLMGIGSIGMCCALVGLLYIEDASTFEHIRDGAILLASFALSTTALAFGAREKGEPVTKSSIFMAAIILLALMALNGLLAFGLSYLDSWDKPQYCLVRHCNIFINLGKYCNGKK